jgi:hypothetical protein
MLGIRFLLVFVLKMNRNRIMNMLLVLIEMGNIMMRSHALNIIIC